MSTEKYQYSLLIDQRAAIALGIKNANQAIVFEYLTKATVWAKAVIIGDQTFYWVHRKITSEQLPFFNLKLDTVYRHYKCLNELGLIEYRKHKGMDCIRITEKARDYFFGNKSEIDKISSNNGSEINPSSKKRLKSCKRKSEINPNNHGNKSDILDKTNIKKTTTTQLYGQDLIWPDIIHENIRPSILKIAQTSPIDEVQNALDELAGRMEAQKNIDNHVGYFKNLLTKSRNGTFFLAYGLKVQEKREKQNRRKRIEQQVMELTEKSRLKQLEKYGKKRKS